MSISRKFKWITGVLEVILGIPVLGYMIAATLAFIPLAVMLVLHIVTLVLSIQDKGKKAGSILGIITSLIAWIPVLDCVMHLATAIVLITAAKSEDPVEKTIAL